MMTINQNFMELLLEDALSFSMKPMSVVKSSNPQIISTLPSPPHTYICTSPYPPPYLPLTPHFATLLIHSPHLLLTNDEALGCCHPVHLHVGSGPPPHQPQVEMYRRLGEQYGVHYRREVHTSWEQSEKCEKKCAVEVRAP